MPQPTYYQEQQQPNMAQFVQQALYNNQGSSFDRYSQNTFNQNRGSAPFQKTYDYGITPPQKRYPEKSGKGFSNWQTSEGQSLPKGDEMNKYRLQNIPISDAPPAPAQPQTLNANAVAFKPGAAPFNPSKAAPVVVADELGDKLKSMN